MNYEEIEEFARELGAKLTDYAFSNPVRFFNAVMAPIALWCLNDMIINLHSPPFQRFLEVP